MEDDNFTFAEEEANVPFDGTTSVARTKAGTIDVRRFRGRLDGLEMGSGTAAAVECRTKARTVIEASRRNNVLMLGNGDAAPAGRAKFVERLVGV